jgi:CheY-like chemotaxis protein
MKRHRRGSTPPSEQELTELGKISGELLHDLANDMTVLQGWALLARGEQEAGRHAAAEIERVLELTSEMGMMLRDVLETVAGRRGAPDARFDPVRLTEETLAQWVRELSGLQVRMHVSLSPDARVAGRSSFWARGLRNVLGNAARHAHSAIHISLAEEVGEGARRVVLRVENDGAGIEADRRVGLFEPLARGSDGRYGLGLSSAGWSVAQLGGTIACVEPGPLGGAAFEIRVPLVDQRAVAGPAAGDTAVAATVDGLQGARLVLMEHDPLVRRAQMRLLRRCGAEVLVLTAEHDPDDVVVSRMEGALPHLVLMDLEDPERDGMAIWNRMCIESPELAERVVFTSGDADGSRARQLSSVTGRPLLSKPISPARLAELVAELRADD